MVKINGKTVPFPYNLIAIPICVIIFSFIGAIFLAIAAVLASPVILLAFLISRML